MYTKYPNYGKSEGLTPDEWWTKVRALDLSLSTYNGVRLRQLIHESSPQIIHATFSPISIPSALPPALLSHFATRRAYLLHTSIPFLLKSLRVNDHYNHTVIGVISNSDPRVASVLRSLGVAIRSYPSMNIHDTADGENGTIDFVTLSYDVGVEKPSQRIFEAAFEEAKQLAGGEDKEWVKVHIGDDMEKDVLAAQCAGWAGVLWDGEAIPEMILDVILRY